MKSMKSAVAAASSALALSACAAHYELNAASGTGAHAGSLPAGSSVSSGSAGLQVQAGGGSPAVAIIAVGVLAAANAATPEERAPARAPDRRIHEQDCSKPIEDPSANLKCR